MEIDKKISDGIITLRCLQPDDVDQKYYSWLQDIEVNRYLEVRHHLPVDLPALRDFVRRVNSSADSILFGIFENESNEHIGNIQLSGICALHRRAEVGFLIGDASRWGKGLVSRAINLVTEFSFNSLGLAKLVAGCYEDNQGSKRALEKAGFILEGRLVDHWVTEGKRCAELVFGRLRGLCFGDVKTLVFIGGGELMFSVINSAREKGFRVAAILSERHALEKIASSGMSIVESLTACGVPVTVIRGVVEVDPRAFGPDFDDSMGFCFGAPWIFPADVIRRFSRGMLNFNGIPIPRYLGGAHYTWQILNRNRLGGCHVQQITEKVDRGDLIMSESFELSHEAQTPDRYFLENYHHGTRFIERFLQKLIDRSHFYPQPFERLAHRSIYFPRLNTNRNGWIDWSWSGKDIRDFCKAFSDPYPGASSMYLGSRIRLLSVSLICGDDIDGFHPFCSGLIVRVEREKFHVSVVGGLLQIDDWKFDDEEVAPLIKVGYRLYTDAETLKTALLHRPTAAGS